MTRLAKVGVETRFTSWGAGLIDLDNDGNPDCFLSQGVCIPKSNENYLSIHTRLSECCFVIWARYLRRIGYRRPVQESLRHTAAVDALSVTLTTMATWTC